MNREIAARETFQKAFDLLGGHTGDLCAYLFEKGRLVEGVQAVAIESAAEEIGSGDEELPQHVGFPRRQRFGIYRVNVGVGQETETLQSLLVSDRFGEGGNRGRIEDVAALHRG